MFLTSLYPNLSLHTQRGCLSSRCMGISVVSILRLVSCDVKGQAYHLQNIRWGTPMVQPAVLDSIIAVVAQSM
jgi:hypothetical protein